MDTQQTQDTAANTRLITLRRELARLNIVPPARSRMNVSETATPSIGELQRKMVAVFNSLEDSIFKMHSYNLKESMTKEDIATNCKRARELICEFERAAIDHLNGVHGHDIADAWSRYERDVALHDAIVKEIAWLEKELAQP